MSGRNEFQGLVILDKPTGITSRQALNRASRWFPRRTRIGHAGTLDPLATGVLILCLNEATRLTEYLQELPKTYQAGLRFGVRSDTDDADGTLTPVEGATVPTLDQVAEALTTFLGVYDQVPPAYSAALVDGQRAHDLARQGRDVPLKPRSVRIDRIDILSYHYPRLDLVIGCGKGTYIRALARDLGAMLGCGGIIESLRRQQVGPFTVEQALRLEAERAEARAHILPLASALCGMPTLSMGDDEVWDLRHGQKVHLKDRVIPKDAEKVGILTSEGQVVGVARVDKARKDLWPERILKEP